MSFEADNSRIHRMTANNVVHREYLDQAGSSPQPFLREESHIFFFLIY